MHKKRRVSPAGALFVCALLTFVLVVAPLPRLYAQDAYADNPRLSPPQLTAEAALPDAPAPNPSNTQDSVALAPPRPIEPEVEPPGSKSHTVASRYAGVIQPWQTAPSLTSHDKLMMGLRRTVSPMAAAGWFFSAGYGQLNNTPHYGSDRGAFGERLGAAAIRDVSEAILTNSFAATFRQDPRYYRAGPTRSITARIRTAAVQPFVTRTDKGGRAINLSLVAGTLAGSALTNAYYPVVDRGAGQTFETFAFSMEGSVVGNLVREFFPDLSDLVFSRLR